MICVLCAAAAAAVAVAVAGDDDELGCFLSFQCSLVSFSFVWCSTGRRIRVCVCVRECYCCWAFSSFHFVVVLEHHVWLCSACIQVFNRRLRLISDTDCLLTRSRMYSKEYFAFSPKRILCSIACGRNYSVLAKTVWKQEQEN